MTDRWLLPMLLALSLCAVPVLAQQPAGEPAQAGVPEQARIPLVNSGGIRNWRLADRTTLYLQDRRGHWYEARLTRPVLTVRTQLAIGFETRGTDTLDRFSYVIIEGERYPLGSLVRLAGEPPGGEGAGQGDAGQDQAQDAPSS